MGGGNLAARPHRVEAHSQEARAVPVQDQFLLFLRVRKEDGGSQVKVNQFILKSDLMATVDST